MARLKTILIYFISFKTLNPKIQVYKYKNNKVNKKVQEVKT